VDSAATTVVRGPLERIILGYGQIGEWAERNGYRTLDGAREVSLHLPTEPGAADYLTEIQQPVEQLTANISRKPRRRRNVDA
jgi:effector-binding domain-containing protein